MPDSKTLIIAYIPVIHQGYVNWLQNYPAAEILVMGQSLTKQFRPLQKDIRALNPDQIVTSLIALGLGKTAQVVEAEALEQLDLTQTQVILPDEQVSHAVAEKFLTGQNLKFEPVFLRWDGNKAIQAQIVQTPNSIDFMTLAKTLATQSADWWRQVGAVAVRDGQVLLSVTNQHLPSQQQPYIDGDPRADFHQGDHIELTTAIHAEARLIAEAAKQGLSLASSSLYVSTFPCPNCAKLVAMAGIKELIFAEGYSVLDGQRVLNAAGVKITQVK